MKILIVGYGFVGQALHASIKRPIKDLENFTYHNRCEVNIVDPKRGTHMKDAKLIQTENGYTLQEHDIIFVCVGTPEAKDGTCDVSQFNNVWRHLKDYEGTVVIKSTLPKDLIPNNINVIYNPEFLNANTAIKDFQEQNYIILGGEYDEARKVSHFYMDYTVIEEPRFEFCTKDEASDFKYIRNIYNAYKVLFWEMCQDTTGNARKMAQMLENLPVNENTQVGMDGFRGFGGACLPKDVSSFDSVHKHKLTKFMLEYNKELSEEA